jgi:hypothetical protein
MEGKSLLHPTTKTYMKADAPVLVEQLATLVQNKFYELPAAEIEQKMFVRGGNDDRDPLQPMTTLERIEHIRNLGGQWLYFEKRNTVRHRAHMETYGRIAINLFEKSRDQAEKRLLQFIMDKAAYKTYLTGNDPNLWHILKDPTALGPEPPSSTPHLRHRSDDYRK